MSENLLWGIDLGGSKIEAVVLDGPTVVARRRIATEAAGGYEHILGRIETLVGEVEAEVGQSRPPLMGMGTPGTLDPTTSRIKNSNTVCLNGRALAADLETRLGCRLTCANDANCFALAEATLGAGRGAASVFGVILGTGVGGGLVVNGHLLTGLHGIAGEWGHNVLEPDGHPCYCGKRGCVETVLGGPWLERHYQELTGSKKSLPQIVQEARSATDPAAVATLARLCEKFGEALSVVVNIFDPHVVVLGGGVGNVDELLTQGRESLRRWIFNDHAQTILVKPQLGDSAGVFGAAMLVSEVQSVSPIK